MVLDFGRFVESLTSSCLIWRGRAMDRGKEEPPTLHTRAKEGRKEERWHKKERPAPE